MRNVRKSIFGVVSLVLALMSAEAFALSNCTITDVQYVRTANSPYHTGEADLFFFRACNVNWTTLDENGIVKDIVMSAYKSGQKVHITYGGGSNGTVTGSFNVAFYFGGTFSNGPVHPVGVVAIQP